MPAAARTSKSPQTVESVTQLVERLLPQADVRAAVLNRLAESVRRAHDSGASLWTINARSKVTLTVGRCLLFTIGSDGVYAGVPEDMVLDPELRVRLDGTRRKWVFSSAPITGWTLSPAEFLELAPQLEPGMIAAPALAAARIRQTPYAYAFDRSVVEYLEATLGVSLPRPQYSKTELPRDPTPVAAGCWVFQCDPKRYDLVGAVHALDELSWTVRQHADEMHIGDAVYLWQSGPQSGVVARARLITDPGPTPDDPAELPFVLDAALLTEDLPQVRLRVEHRFSNVVARSRLIDEPEFKGATIARATQGTNFRLTPDQATAIERVALAPRERRVVKIAPGRLARMWSECEKEGYIWVGWDEVGDLRSYPNFDAFRLAFGEKAEPGKSAGHVTVKAKEVWTLRELLPGDLIVANRGIDEVVGIGQVVAPGYEWHGDRPGYRHAVKVKWDTSCAGKIPRQELWAMKTVADVGDGVKAALGIGPSRSPVPGSSPYDELRSKIASKLVVGDELLSHYVVALQTKRFVILSGISGTGKTQIAISVAKAFGAESTVAGVPASGTCRVRRAPYMTTYQRIVLPAALRERLEASETGEQPGISMRVLFGDHDSVHRVSTHRGARQVLLKSELAQRLAAAVEVGEPFDLALDEKQDPPELRISTSGAEIAPTRDRALEVVAVRPDWTDHRGLLGFFNPITSTYVRTPFLDLLLLAAREEARALAEKRTARPYFAVLDEMNLARVEHYFADFLSAMESSEPIHLHDERGIEDGEEELGDALPIPRRLPVPTNLFVTGTVNIDETTHMFSSKVLDRAFVIELNEVDLSGDVADTAGLRLDAFLGLPVADADLSGKPTLASWKALSEIRGGEPAEWVREMHSILEQDHRHFGHRVAQEMAHFIRLLVAQAGEDEETVWAALDLAILSKILPKLHGTQAQLEPTLLSLMKFCVDGDPAGDRWKLERGRLVPTTPTDDSAWLPRSAAKVWRMLRRLEQQGFTSFIE